MDKFDTTIATTQSIDNRVDSKVDTALENDVLVNATGLTKSATGGQVTLGIGANSVDLDRIKDDDIITYAEQPTIASMDLYWHVADVRHPCPTCYTIRF